MIHHDFYTPEDGVLAGMLPEMTFCRKNPQPITIPFERQILCEPDDRFGFLHEAAILEH